MRQYRLFGVINPFDVLIAASVVLIVLGLNMYAAPQHVLADRGVPVRFVLELQNRPEGFYREILEAGIGTTVVDAVRGFGIGTVEYAFGGEVTIAATDETYRIVRRAVVEDFEVTHIVVSALANITDYAIEIGPFHLRTGMWVSVRSSTFTGTAMVGIIQIGGEIDD